MAVRFNLVESVRSYLNRNDYRYEYDAEEEMIEFGLVVKNKLKRLDYLMEFTKYGFKVSAACALSADESTRDEVMKYITMVNYGLQNGNFEMDLNDGEIRYRVYMDLDGMDCVSDDIIQDSIYIPAMMFDRYGNGLAALLMGFSDAETEVKKAESK